MLDHILKNEKTLCFIGGIASALISTKFLKSGTGRDICVKGLAKGMRLQMEAMEAFQNIKEDATDLCVDAKRQVAAEGIARAINAAGTDKDAKAHGETE